MKELEEAEKLEMLRTQIQLTRREYNIGLKDAINYLEKITTELKDLLY